MHATRRGGSVALWIATVVAAFGIGWIASPPHEPPTPDDLAASLRSALGEGDAIERQARTASLLERLDPDVVLEVAALYERMIPLIEKSELAAFFAAWARFDPHGALDRALSWSRLEMDAQRQIGVQWAFRSWAQREPLAALLGAEQISADIPALRPALRLGLVTGWANSSRGQEGLAGYIAGLPAQQKTLRLVEAVARELVRGGGTEAALGWAEPALRHEGYAPFFKRWVFQAAAGSAAQWDPERAAAWVEEHSGAAYAKQGVGIVAERWGRQDGAAAMVWLGEQPAGELRDEAARGAFGQWLRADSSQAKAWLEAEKPTALHDAVLVFQAERTAEHVPEYALGLCERVQDTARQQSCLEFAAKRWYMLDAVTAEAWIQQSSLDEEARRRVREVPVTREQKRRGVWRPR